MMRIVSAAYGIVSYIVFLAAFLYAIGFTGNLMVPKAIDSGSPTGITPSLAINLALLALFAMQHTVMARPAFKRWWIRIIPEQLERSTFVLAASLILLLLFWQWRPLPAVIWSVDSAVGRGIIWALFALGWAMVLVSTFLINHFDLFGLRQVTLYFQNRPYSHPKFTTAGFYRVVRHPIMLGFIIAFWATPDMTAGHLLFAVGTTAYIIVGIHFEEHDLKSYLGEDYHNYRSQVPMLCPFTLRRPKPQAVSQTTIVPPDKV